MIVQDLYSGTLRLNELLRESEEARILLQNQIRLLATDVQQKQNDLEICEENIRYLEKQTEVLKYSINESNINVKILLAERDDLRLSNRRLDHRANQAETLFSALKQQTDSANMRRILYGLKKVKDTQRAAHMRLSFLSWKHLVSRCARLNLFERKVDHNAMTAVLHAWLSLQLSSKLDSEITKSRYLECRLGEVAAEIVECRKDAIEILQSVQDDYSKVPIIVESIHAGFGNKMKSEKIKRMNVRIERVIRYWSKKNSKRALHGWMYWIKNICIKRRHCSVCDARSLKYLHHIRKESFSFWVKRWTGSRTLACYRKQAGALLVKNMHQARRTALANLIEDNKRESNSGGGKTFDNIIRLLYRTNVQSYLQQFFTLWHWEAKLQPIRREHFMHALLFQSSYCKSYCSSKYCISLKKPIVTAEAFDLHRRFEDIRDVEAVKSDVTLNLPFGAAFMMNRIMYNERLVRCFGIWTIQHFRIRRRNRLLGNFRHKNRICLLRCHFVEWTNHQHNAEKLACQLRMDALAQELICMAEAKVADEVQFAVANDRIVFLEELSSAEITARQALETQLQEVVIVLQDLQSKWKEQEQDRTVTRVLRVLSHWKLSRARCVLKNWTIVTREIRIHVVKTERSLLKISKGFLRSAFAIWYDNLIENSNVAEEQWINSLQEQLMALTGLQVTTESQLESLAQENVALRQSITCTVHASEVLQNTLSIMRTVQAYKFWRVRALRCHWIIWCSFHFKSLSRRTIIRRIHLKTLSSLIPMFAPCALSRNVIDICELLNKRRICGCWRIWKSYRSLAHNFYHLKARCVAASIPRRINDAFVKWSKSLCEKKEILGRHALKLIEGIVACFGEDLNVHKNWFPCKIPEGTISGKISKVKNLVSSRMLLSINGKHKATLWLLVQLAIQSGSVFGSGLCTGIFLSWKSFVMKKRRCKRGVQMIAIKRLHNSGACALQQWADWHCNALACAEQTRFDSYDARQSAISKGSSSHLDSPSCYENPNLTELNIGTFSIAHQVHTVKFWLRLLDMERHRREAHTQSKIRNALNEDEQRLIQYREKHAVKRVLRFLCFWKRIVLKRCLSAMQRWTYKKSRCIMLTRKVVKKHLFMTKSRFFSSWTGHKMQSEIQSNNLRIKALEDNVVQALQLKDTAEASVLEMVELKQEMEKLWNQKHYNAVQGLERRLAESQRQLHELEIRSHETYLISAATRVARVINHFKHTWFRQILRNWKHQCLRKNFLHKTVHVFLQCVLLQTFEWWTLQAENLKAQALEISAYSLEQQLINVNQKLRHRLHTSEVQVRYVLEEQDQIQKAWNLRHVALKNSLNMQLAHTNQMRVSMGKIYADLRNDISALRIIHFLKFWLRLRRFRIFSEIKFSYLHKRKCRRLSARSKIFHSLHIFGRYFCFWKSHHFEVNVMKLKNIIVETQLCAVKEINKKENDIGILMDQMRETMASTRQLSNQLEKASPAARLAASTDLIAFFPDLEKFKAEAGALRLEADHQVLFQISSPPQTK